MEEESTQEGAAIAGMQNFAGAAGGPWHRSLCGAWSAENAVWTVRPVVDEVCDTWAYQSAAYYTYAEDISQSNIISA